MDQLSLESNTEQSSDAVDPSTDTHTAVIQGLNATLAQFAEASETRTAMLASLKKIFYFVLTQEKRSKTRTGKTRLSGY